MTKNDILNEYFEWLYSIVTDGMFSPQISYRKLLMYLHTVRFRFVIEKDINRAKDGEELRWRFILATGNEENTDFASALDIGRSSVLEMMIALAIRCEETIMDNSKIGDRTKQWFWGMINNLGLSSFTDSNFNKEETADIVDRFLDREYEPDGTGGLFRIRNSEYDLRDVELWVQLLWYLDSLTM